MRAQHVAIRERCGLGGVERPGAVLVLALINVAVAALAFSSVATPILASLLILGGLGLAVVAWAERG